MRYVVAGYVVVLAILFLYAVQLIWRRRRLTRTTLRIESGPADPARRTGTTGTTGTGRTTTATTATPAVRADDR